MVKQTNRQRIFLSSPHMSDEGFERQFVQQAFDTNWIAPLGENVNCFESEFQECIAAPAAAALSSGTAAIHLALKAAGVEQGDYVICQSLTFSATANPIIYLGAKPVFVDSENETWNMSPNALECALKTHPKTKAVIVVHLYGTPAKLDEIAEICNRYNVVMIEDACESLGATYMGKSTGTFGKYSAFSFNGNKIITTSGGGMFVANGGGADEAAKRVRFWATQSRDNAPYYQHSELGYNYRMSNVVAGIGRGQLKVLDARVAKKRYIFDCYKKQLSGLDGVSFLSFANGVMPNNWLSCMLSRQVAPTKIIAALDTQDIEARRVWKPMHLQPFFEKYDYIDNGGIAEFAFDNGVCLPSDTKMTDDDIKRTVAAIRMLWE